MQMQSRFKEVIKQKYIKQDLYMYYFWRKRRENQLSMCGNMTKIVQVKDSKEQYFADILEKKRNSRKLISRKVFLSIQLLQWMVNKRWNTNFLFLSIATKNIIIVYVKQNWEFLFSYEQESYYFLREFCVNKKLIIYCIIKRHFMQFFIVYYVYLYMYFSYFGCWNYSDELIER